MTEPKRSNEIQAIIEQHNARNAMMTQEDIDRWWEDLSVRVWNMIKAKVDAPIAPPMRPIDIARAAWRRAGFVQVQSAERSDDRVVFMYVDGFRELWRLPEAISESPADKAIGDGT